MERKQQMSTDQIMSYMGELVGANHVHTGAPLNEE